MSKEKKIYLSPPHMSGKEKELVQEAIDSNWIAPLGPNVDGFEKELCDYTGAKHIAALSSGTASLHLALILAGVKSEDVVICQSLTFSASANPIVYQGAYPVFVDSESYTWNMCPEQLENAIFACLKGELKINKKNIEPKKPKAIIAVHLYGMPAKMDEINAVAEKYDIPVIEDAAEALGSVYKGNKAGNLGKMSILSFNGNKIITTSGGGALLSEDKTLIDKAKFLSTQARDPAPYYLHTNIGYNYRMSNILAAIGRGQLEMIDEKITKRRNNYESYKSKLENIDGITFLDEPEGFFSNRWLTTILVDPEKSKGISRENIISALEKENIESRPVWKPMHTQPIFEKYPFFGTEVSDNIFDKGLCLPSGTELEEKDIEHISNIIKSLFL